MGGCLAGIEKNGRWALTYIWVLTLTRPKTGGGARLPSTCIWALTLTRPKTGGVGTYQGVGAYLQSDGNSTEGRPLGVSPL